MECAAAGSQVRYDLAHVASSSADLVHVTSSSTDPVQVAVSSDPRKRTPPASYLKLHIYYKARLVAQSVMSATDMQGHWDISGLSAIDPRLRQWISVQGCLHAIITGVGNFPPHVSGWGYYNTY